MRYNLIRKRVEITVPWVFGTVENGDAVSLSHVLSLASQYGMPTGLVPTFIDAIADENAYNPVADWIASHAWDGQDRLAAICNTITPTAGYPLELRDSVVTRWLLSVSWPRF